MRESFTALRVFLVELVGEKEKHPVSSSYVKLEINVPKWHFNGVFCVFLSDVVSSDPAEQWIYVVTPGI